jgi:hypothetical protein
MISNGNSLRDRGDFAAAAATHFHVSGPFQPTSASKETQVTNGNEVKLTAIVRSPKANRN